MAIGALTDHVHTILDHNLNPREAVLEISKFFGFMDKFRDYNLKPGATVNESAFDPDTYHYDELIRCESELKKWQEMSLEDRKSWVQKQVDEYEASLKEALDMIDLQNNKLRHIIDYVSKMEVPDELKQFKNYTLSKLRESIQDTADYYHDTFRPKGDLLLNSRESELISDIEYHKFNWEKDQNRAEECKKHYKLLIQALDETDAMVSV